MNPDALDEMRRIFGAKLFPILLHGAVGRGKSFLAATIFVRWSGTASMMRYSDFVSDAIKASREGSIGRYGANGAFCEHTEAGWWRHLQEVGLVVLDEIGSGTSHEWRNEILWKLLEVRRGKPLLMTGNLDPKELAQRFDVRIQSRIIAGTLFELGGTDQRLDGLKSRIVRVG